MDIPANSKMATGYSADVTAGPESKPESKSDATKSEVQDSVGPVDADPSREVSKKRQSLSDLFTIVGRTERDLTPRCY